MHPPSGSVCLTHTLSITFVLLSSKLISSSQPVYGMDDPLPVAQYPSMQSVRQASGKQQITTCCTFMRDKIPTELIRTIHGCLGVAES